MCAALGRRHDVHVFTREENPFAADGVVRRARDSLHPEVNLHIVNAARVGINYDNQGVNRAFARTAEEVKPEVAHIGHLNHLSLGIADVLAKMEIPIVFTLHDFWLMCLRGQFIQIAAADDGTIFPLCDGQDDKKCAERCLRRFAAGDDGDAEDWRRWVAKRTAAVRRVAELTDIFIAPARSLAERFRRRFPLPEQKIIYLDYGFDRQRLSGRRRGGGGNFVFGYIGTHIPGKGVHHLLDAFVLLAAAAGGCELHIWGRPTVATKYLQMRAAAMPPSVQNRIRWRGEYRNPEIVAEVFNETDAIVVPSIWEENSPLVIHEAQQARLPVIAANMGGMAEYVRHEENGLLFAARDPEDLARQMKRFAGDPGYARRLGGRGYLYAEDGDVPDIADHVRGVEMLYRRVIENRRKTRVKPMRAPWRITFDTNPDHCNYRCTMCEEHSPYSPLQFRRRAAGNPRRVMPFDVIARNVRRMAGRGLREIIPSTMGEPLLYKQFPEIISLCRETGVMLNLTTNGSFPRLGAEKWARLLVPVASDIKISWNGACKKTHEAIMKNASWEKMLANVRTLAAVRDEHAEGGGGRCRLTFQTTFMESNCAELPALVRLASSLGIDRVKGHHLWAHFAEIKGEDMRRDADSVRRWNEIAERANAAAAGHPLPNGEKVLLENIERIESGDGGGASGRCPFLGREAWIGAGGRFDPCCAPDAERRTLGEFGNLHESDLLEIWNGEPYRLLVKTYSSRTVCQKCNMRKRV
ncbi:MAG: glycosyltransferase [Gammaproteobacteria bacterium]